ncbi:phosphatidylserine/phosphatidylglycerophosphate/cardiolipin synthase family protein [Allopontixanthobacter sp.]|uniref:phospholipase D-like domain-containing protein n=1 Tax=Allopontixanthobacter sp. TaxID=2906452 RepID=UPI002AB8B0AD|nr:phosphatidylserine/phosphatidylglycerophosphate/cardiolipin synthase family protein [Allopontixanthobacter sp.]MDZ4306901.1 phosphatidylserine/phosphatidylglycerophosphate/cardiolipin synthase family protein [Allopontixanthobacter sp.]
MGEERSSGEGVAYAELPPFAITAQGQELTFYPAGKDRLARLLEMIGGARESVRLCFYIFAVDDAGQQVRDALIAAARRGVAVTLILDGFGADADEEFLQPLRDAGGTWHKFSSGWTQRYLIRNHQKMVIADGTAMLGGFNIADAYFAPPDVNGWNDLAVTLQGSAVTHLSRWFDALERWSGDPKAKWLAVSRMIREWDPGQGPVQLLIGGPTRTPSSWMQAIRKDLAGGRRMDMVMAYFSPASRMARRIGHLARRGSVRLVMAGKSDNNATIGAARSMYDYLLGCSAKIWEFTLCKLHTKLIVIDDAVYFGSANFDMRSLYVNLELMLRIEDAALADRMRTFIGWHIAASEEITPQLNKRRATLFNRFRWNLAWFLVAVVDYNVSRRLNLGL